jgi:hypothetical protein
MILKETKMDCETIRYSVEGRVALLIAAPRGLRNLEPL